MDGLSELYLMRKFGDMGIKFSKVGQHTWEPEALRNSRQCMISISRKRNGPMFNNIKLNKEMINRALNTIGLEIDPKEHYYSDVLKGRYSRRAFYTQKIKVIWFRGDREL